MTAAELPIAAVVAGLLGLVVGHLVDRAARSFPWPPHKRSWRQGAVQPGDDGVAASELDDGGGVVVPSIAVLLVTALLFVLAALRFGLSWELPAFLFLAATGVLLAVIDLAHHLLPNRVVVPSIGIGAVLLLVAALAGQEWGALLRAALGAMALFAVFLALALISPRGLGLGDVKLAGLLGLYLGWIGWDAVVFGAAAGFVIQALLAALLLLARRVGRRGELPFGPAMLLGAVVAIGWDPAVLG